MENIQISKNFSLQEFIASDTATKKGIDNEPTDEIVGNIKYLVETLLQPLRDKISYPFHVNSGFRCKSLNKAVKGSDTSAHLLGLAADISLGSKQLNKILYEEVKNHEKDYEFDQCINEKNYSWIHLGLKPKGTKNRKQLFAIN